MGWIPRLRATALFVTWQITWLQCSTAGPQTTGLLQVVLAENHGVMFCHDCTDPMREGSYSPLLASLSSPRGYFVATDLVYGVPNTGNKPLFNEDEVRGRIVLLERGKVSFSRKVRHAQEAGAQGVIIIDNPTCSDRSSPCFDAQRYSPSLATLEADGTATGLATPTSIQIKSRDSATAWLGIEIPSVLISQADGGRLRSLMSLETFEFEGERQYVNRI